MMSANAIAAIGPGAAPSVPALIAACSVQDEQVHVLRACAAALGAIGRAAAPALPVLREIAKQPRVRWAAEAAIRAIGDDAP
jgi:HEAT repeat protein